MTYIIFPVGNSYNDIQNLSLSVSIDSFHPLVPDDELKNQLLLMRDRLDDPVLISSDLVMNMLLAFREIQDYNSMVKLVEDLDPIAGYSGNYQRTDHISFLYAFALNRRRDAGKKKSFALNAHVEILCSCSMF